MVSLWQHHMHTWDIRCLSNRAYIYKKVNISKLPNSILTESSLHKLITSTEDDDQILYIMDLVGHYIQII